MLTKWTEQLFHEMRYVGDCSTDTMIQSAMQENRSTDIYEAMRHFAGTSQLGIEGVSPNLQSYLLHFTEMPKWANKAKLEKGSKFFQHHVFEIVMLLVSASLPTLYANRYTVEVLSYTKRLSDDVHQRIIDTAQFVFDVTCKDAFIPNGHGIRAIQRVRFAHSIARYHIQSTTQGTTKWQADWGIPINQTDMVSTMLSFSVIILQGLEKAKIKISPEDKDAYFHLWAVVGYLLGIEADLIPLDMHEGLEFMGEWKRLYYAESRAGQKLAAELVNSAHSYMQDRVLKDLLVCWLRFNLGHSTADLLHIPPYNWAVMLLQLQRLGYFILNQPGNTFTVIEKLNRRLNGRILESVFQYKTDRQHAHFEIPEQLRDHLELIS